MPAISQRSYLRGRSPWANSSSPLTSIAEQPAWMRFGVCATVDPELWFPEVATANAVKKPKELCRSCPVRTLCLEYALERRDEHGVWGGLAPSERAAILRVRGSEVAA